VATTARSIAQSVTATGEGRMQIELSQLFTWSDFWGLLSVVAFLLLGFWAGYKRGKKAGKDELKMFLLGESIAYLMERDGER
jgi:cbb3-type cytochrome oxidase subunit 3